jgi:hypothetical protein
MHDRTHNPLRPPRLGLAHAHAHPGLAAWLLPGLALLPLLGAPVASGVPAIWTGPTTNFTDVAGSDPTQPANQDRLTPGVWITRGSIEGIYNAATETGFTHDFSPQDTEWADGTTANYASLSYANWNYWAKTIHNGPPSTVGVPVVVHLIAEDIYLDAKFTSWGVSAGGFSWQRSTAGAVQTPPSLSAQVINNTLDLSWSVAGWQLQGQTNNPEAGITTNWVTVPGSTATNHVIIPISPSIGGAFFRLASP